jgi:hypothetical protein
MSEANVLVAVSHKAPRLDADVVVVRLIVLGNKKKLAVAKQLVNTHKHKLSLCCSSTDIEPKISLLRLLQNDTNKDMCAFFQKKRHSFAGLT